MYLSSFSKISADESRRELREQTNYTGTIVLLLVAMALQVHKISFPEDQSHPWQVTVGLIVVVSLYLCVYVQEYMAIYVRIDKI